MSVIISLDFGVKKMGMAVGNKETATAQPLDILPMNNGQPDWLDLLHHITHWQATMILVGLPLHMDGSESHLSKRATKFAKRLNHKLKEHHIKCDVYLVDERLSSYEAKHHNKSQNKKNTAYIDDKAAYVLLNSWFHDAQSIKLP